MFELDGVPRRPGARGVRPRRRQAADRHPLRHPARRGGIGMKATDMSAKTADELKQQCRDLRRRSSTCASSGRAASSRTRRACARSVATSRGSRPSWAKRARTARRRRGRAMPKRVLQGVVVSDAATRRSSSASSAASCTRSTRSSSCARRNTRRMTRTTSTRPATPCASRRAGRSQAQALDRARRAADAPAAAAARG